MVRGCKLKTLPYIRDRDAGCCVLRSTSKHHQKSAKPEHNTMSALDRMHKQVVILHVCWGRVTQALTSFYSYIQLMYIYVIWRTWSSKKKEYVCTEITQLICAWDSLVSSLRQSSSLYSQLRWWAEDVRRREVRRLKKAMASLETDFVVLEAWSGNFASWNKSSWDRLLHWIMLAAQLNHVDELNDEDHASFCFLCFFFFCKTLNIYKISNIL